MTRALPNNIATSVFFSEQTLLITHAISKDKEEQTVVHSMVEKDQVWEFCGPLGPLESQNHGFFGKRGLDTHHFIQRSSNMRRSC